MKEGFPGLPYRGPIPEGVKARLRELAGAEIPEVDLERARLHVGTWLARGILRWIPDPLPGVDPAAVTVGRHIFLQPAFWPPERLPAFVLLAHELVHVRQWRVMGPWRFLIAYLRDYLCSPQRYAGVRLEQEAAAIAARVEARGRERGLPV